MKTILLICALLLLSPALAQALTCDQAAIVIPVAGPYPCSITVTWQDNSGNNPLVNDQEDAFEIERSVNGAPFALFGSVARNITTYVDNTLSAVVGVDNDYCYRIRAVKGTLISGYTNTVCKKILALPIPVSKPADPSGAVIK